MERAVDIDINKITCQDRVWVRKIELLVEMIKAVTIFLMSMLPFEFLYSTSVFLCIHFYKYNTDIIAQLKPVLILKVLTK